MSKIQAIQTSYRGCRFRSRLEARWAVFFDALGLRWEYEPQGFEVITNDGPEGPKWYYLPDFYLPEFGCWVEIKGSLEDVSQDYLDMIAWAVDYGGCLPGMCDSHVSSCQGLLWLGSIPDAQLGENPGHVLFQHYKGGRIVWCRFGWFKDKFHGLHRCEDEEHFDANDAPAVTIRKVLFRYYNERCYVEESYPSQVLHAYQAARSARFEHGEQPTF